MREKDNRGGWGGVRNVRSRGVGERVEYLYKHQITIIYYQLFHSFPIINIYPVIFQFKMDLIPITTRDLFFKDPFFRSSWDDFGRVREGMLAEPRDMLQRFEDDFMNARCLMEGGIPWSSK